MSDDQDDVPGSPDTKTSRPAPDLVPPASSRQPRSLKDELPLDDELPGILDPEAEPAPASEERPPASRKVASVRGTDAHVEDFSTWEIDGITAEPPPTWKAGLLGVERSARPEETRGLVEFRTAARAFSSPTFGDLFDASLSLGEDDA